MQDIKNRIEAILFTTGRFMDIEEIAQLCNIGSVGAVKEALAGLVEDYNARGGALEIFEEKGKYKLNIKKAYNYLTTKLLDSTELDRPTQETLAIIAYRNPVLQADIVKLRGNKAYDHIKALKEIGFVTVEKHGRTRLVKLTQKFFDYFDIVDAKQLGDRFKEIENRVMRVGEKKQKEEEAEENAAAEDSEAAEEAPEEDSGDEPTVEETSSQVITEEDEDKAVEETLKEEES